jgi:hypothetical protein
MSAKNHDPKDKCHREEISALLSNQKILNNWYNLLTVVWLASEKAKIQLTECREAKSYGFEEFAQEDPAKSQEYLKIREICNSGGIEEAQQSILLYEALIPLVSDAEFLEIFQKHQNGLTNKKTNKPISINDLRNLDLNDMSNFSFAPSPDFEKEIKPKLTKVLEKREAMTELIQDSLRDGSYQLNENLKDYLFEDGTVRETLAASSLLESPGERCITARYSPQAYGEIADFAATTVVGGPIVSGALQVIKGAKHLSGLKKFKKFMKTLEYGLGVEAAKYVAQTAAKECPLPFVESKGYRVPKLVENATIDNLSIDKALTPSCSKEDVVGYRAVQLEESNCLLSLLLSISPI